jgi:hypothetical protein
VIDSFGTWLTYWYGPVPSGLAARPVAVEPVGTMPVSIVLRPDGNDASGCFMCTTTVVGFGAATLATDSKNEAPLESEAGFMIISNVYFTSAEVSDVPPVNFTPLLSVNVYVSPPSPTTGSPDRPGTRLPFESVFSSVL